MRTKRKKKQQRNEPPPSPPPSRIEALYCLLEWLAGGTGKETLLEWKKSPGNVPLVELFKGVKHLNKQILLAVWVTLRHTGSRLELVSYQTNSPRTTLTTIATNPQGARSPNPSILGR